MKKQYPYSNDKQFLSKIDALHVREQWVKIILLEYNSEIPLDNIEGKITNGTLTKSGESTVRRTCNLTCVADSFKYNIDDIKANYSISKKIYLELGISNDTDEYIEENIIWFPQGVFFITSFSISSAANGNITINLQFKDKIAQLDGTIGGILPATTRFDIITTMVDGIPVTNKALVYDIIMETVNHFGGENLSNIIIDDIPKKAKRIIRWMGSESIWIYPIVGNNNEISYDICFSSDLDEKRAAHTPPIIDGEPIGAKEYKTNQDIGYMYENFVYDQELTFNAGAKVTDVLDKIKDWLGNYEYFYDEQGQFHFQEIKNYLNNAQSAYIWDKIIKTNDFDYLHESTQGKNIYTFDDNTNLISITNTPIYENIKNDFIVEGTSTINNIERTCRYHLVIDDKPTITTEGYDNILIYTDPMNGNTTLTKPTIIPPQIIDNQQVWLLPEFGTEGTIYGFLNEPKDFIFEKPLRDMDNFAEYYNTLVNQENTLITQEEDYILTNEIENFLFDLLERYMGYPDDTSYKSIYIEMIFTLARQLQKYNVNKRTPVLSTTTDYYNNLYNQFISDINNHSESIKEKISWCGGLLYLLYNLFNGLTDPSINYSDYIDNTYWPSIDTQIIELWENLSFLNNSDTMRQLRKNRCLDFITSIEIKQKELNKLIEAYTQIINNYDVLITSNNRNHIDASNLVSARNAIRNQVINYKAQQDLCNERLNILYAILTALGASDSNIGETYYFANVTIPVFTTSFWYYNTNTNENNYGWNEVEWYRYYSSTGSMNYIDYSNINWEKIEFNNNDYRPSMDCSSQWYQTYFIDYANEYDLPCLNSDGADYYIPTDWRTELILMGLRAEENGTDPGHYYQELKANWPTVYDFKAEQLSASSVNYIDYFVGKTGVILGEECSFSLLDDSKNSANTNTHNSTKAKFKLEEADIQNLTLNYENDCYYYFFDMIDSSSSIWGEYSIKNIGRRTNVNVNDNINCIFAPDIPDFAFINISNLTLEDRREIYTELQDIAENIIQVTDTFYNNFATGGFKQSAYEQIRYDLQQHTSYQNTISIVATPCFYLEPNTRVGLNDNSTGTYGDYIVKSVSIPLGIGNNMSVNMSKAFERI